MPGRFLAAVTLVSLSILASLAAAQSSTNAPKPGSKPATPEQIAQWVDELDADQFVLREQATTRLIEAGAGCVDPLASAVPNGSLEVVIRGIHVLRELAVGGDLDTQEAARAALDRIAAARLTAAARKAEVTLASLNEARQSRAIDELQKLGAKISTSHVQFGVQVAENATVLEVGPEWRGQLSDLRRLKFLLGIQHIKFTGGQVTDEWLEFVARMENLTNLTLKRTSVTSAGLKHVRNLPRLQVVWLMYSPIDDGAIPHLSALKQATQMKLYGTQITAAAAKKLADELATAKVDYRQGAFLGVNCQAHPLGCEVVLVQNNTAAAAAGLQSNDVILKYGGARVDTFETLTAEISKNKPGDAIEVELIREPRLRRVPFVRKQGEAFGATTQAHVLGCEITAVQPDSIAERMEFKPGDIIVGYQENRVFDPAALKAAFDASKPGDAVSLDFVRQPEILKRTIKLGEWE